MPLCPDWTAIKVFGKIQRLVAGVNLRFISGPDLNRDPEWISNVVAYVVDISRADAYLKLFPAFLRPLAFRILPVSRRLNRIYAKAYMIWGRAHENRSKAKADVSSSLEQDHFQEWAKYKKIKDGNPLTHVKLQLSFGFAAVATTGTALVSVLHDLVANPDWVAMLREEIEEVSLQEGELLNGESLSKLSKMDSFMKESQRIYPFTQIASLRRVQQDITLDNGTTLKRGSICVAANSAISTDQRYYGEDAQYFDPLRFHKLRQSQSPMDRLDKYKFTAVNHEMLPWGYGRHVCPGRFLAHDSMKIILALLIMNYDMQLGDKAKGRPVPWRFGHTIIPDPTVEIQFKSRKI